MTAEDTKSAVQSGPPDMPSPSRRWWVALAVLGAVIIGAALTASRWLPGPESESAGFVPIQVAEATATPPGPNLVPNSSVEEADAPDDPDAWSPDEFGEHDAAYDWIDTGYMGSRALQVKITEYQDGDAKWYFDPQPVTPGAYYRFSDYYRSDVITHVSVAFFTEAGQVDFEKLRDAPPSQDWTMYDDGAVAPGDAVSATVFHVLGSAGTLATDEFSFRQTATPSPFERGLVSITFDDGWATDYDAALPILRRHGVNGTHYIISGFVGDTDKGYMTARQIKKLVASGEEIASHTVSHQRLNQVPPHQVAYEVEASKAALQRLTGQPITQFALPWGEHNAQVMDEVRKTYGSARTTINGFNTPSNFNEYRIIVKPVEAGLPLTKLKTWVDTAKQEKQWLVLMYHKIDDSGGSSVTPENFEAAIEYIQSVGVPIATVGQARAELEPQVAR